MKDKLKAYRQKQGYTQAEIARMAGITQAGYSRMETGKADPSLKLLKRIGKYLGFTVELKDKIIIRDRTADDVNKEYEVQTDSKECVICHKPLTAKEIENGNCCDICWLHRF